MLLIVANVVVFMAGTTAKVNGSGANVQLTGALWVFEAVSSVTIFTVLLNQAIGWDTSNVTKVIYN